MRIYGITGGAGSGKSEAARHFATLGIPVIDADKAGHDVIAPGGAAEESLIKEFGDSILTSGTIDREKVSHIVFNDPDALQRLNRIVHPAIFGVIGERIAALGEGGHARVLIDAALLAEKGVKEPWLHGLILVTAPAEERIRRLVELRGMPREEAERRLAAQSPPESKRPLADWVIENHGGLDELHAAVAAVVSTLDGELGP
jgi:dephospho-CoA kinase